jgi:endogenous inhibitor of DNA gyrase (YacG/DUF329 family)
MTERTCPTCGDPFTSTRGRQFCSEGCWPSRQGRFAAARGEVEPTGDLRELTALLWEAARRGSVAAAGLLLRELKADGRTGSSVPSFIDELAARRRGVTRPGMGGGETR